MLKSVAEIALHFREIGFDERCDVFIVKAFKDELLDSLVLHVVADQVADNIAYACKLPLATSFSILSLIARRIEMPTLV